MPRYRHAAASPIAHLADGQRWPNGQLQHDAPPEAVHAQAVAKRLHYEMQNRTKTEVAALADITADALGRLMRGHAWGALPVIIRLEQALEADLWCGKPHHQQQ